MSVCTFGIKLVSGFTLEIRTTKKEAPYLVKLATGSFAKIILLALNVVYLNMIRPALQSIKTLIFLDQIKVLHLFFSYVYMRDDHFAAGSALFAHGRQKAFSFCFFFLFSLAMKKLAKND